MQSSLHPACLRTPLILPAHPVRLLQMANLSGRDFLNPAFGQLHWVKYQARCHIRGGAMRPRVVAKGDLPTTISDEIHNALSTRSLAGLSNVEIPFLVSDCDGETIESPFMLPARLYTGLCIRHLRQEAALYRYLLQGRQLATLRWYPRSRQA